MTHTVFSVIIPIHNAGEYLEQSILSVVNQSLRNWELLLIDDGSTDESLKIADHWYEQDDRIKVLQHQGGLNKGVSASRNLGIQNAKAAWVAFLDADDVWLPEKLEKQYAVIKQYEKENLVLVYGQAQVIDEQGCFIEDQELAKSHNPLHSVYGSGKPGFERNTFKWAVKSVFDAPTSTVVCKKELILGLGGFEEDMRFSEDALMWYRMLEKGNMYFMDEPLIHYRVHLTQWNAAAGIKLKATRRFIAYTRLLKKSAPFYRSYLSYLLVTKGFRIIVRTNVGYPYFNWRQISSYNIKIWKDPNVLMRHKLLSPFIFLFELFLLPVRLLLKWTKQ